MINLLKKIFKSGQGGLSRTFTKVNGGEVCIYPSDLKEPPCTESGTHRTIHTLNGDYDVTETLADIKEKFRTSLS